MPYYESVFIARQAISAPQVEALAETFAGIIGEGGGQVTKKEYWGLRNLAYRIKKNRKGHYTLLNIDAPSAAVQEMERSMRINEDVLRYMTIRVDELEDGASVMMIKGGKSREAQERRHEAVGEDRRASREDARAKDKAKRETSEETAGAHEAPHDIEPADKAEERREKAAAEAGGDEASEKEAGESEVREKEAGETAGQNSEAESEAEGEKA